MEVTIKNLESYLAKTYGGFAEKNGVALAENNLFMKLIIDFYVFWCYYKQYKLFFVRKFYVLYQMR